MQRQILDKGGEGLVEMFSFRKKTIEKEKNIAGRLPENSRDRRLWPIMN